jgi:hypothetical protein
VVVSSTRTDVALKEVSSLDAVFNGRVGDMLVANVVYVISLVIDDESEVVE